MVHNIKKANTNGNVIIKLDMAKTFNKMDQKFICHALKKFNFNEQWIDMIWRLLSLKISFDRVN